MERVGWPGAQRSFGAGVNAGVGSPFVDRRGRRRGEPGPGGRRAGWGRGRFRMLPFLRARVSLAGREPACGPSSLADRQLPEGQRSFVVLTTRAGRSSVEKNES